MIRKLLLTTAFVATAFGVTLQSQGADDWYKALPGPFVSKSTDFYKFIKKGADKGLVTFARGILKKCPHCQKNVK